MFSLSREAGMGLCSAGSAWPPGLSLLPAPAFSFRLGPAWMGRETSLEVDCPSRVSGSRQAGTALGLWGPHMAGTSLFKWKVWGQRGD